MLALAEKKGTTVDLVGPVAEYIITQFSDRDAEEAEDDLQRVNEMRAEVVAGGQGFESRKELLQKYYRAVCAMESRFPVREPVVVEGGKKTAAVEGETEAGGSGIVLAFTWHDAFQPKKHATLNNLHFEKASVLFNLAACESSQAAGLDRSSPEGAKQACHLFQMAAGSCAHIRDSVGLKVGSGGGLDLGKECCNMLVWLMLAQAQECVHAKAKLDDKSPAILAKLAKQASVYYEEAHTAMCSPPLASYLDKSWQAHVQVKASIFASDAFFRAALQLKAEEKIGPQIARLKQAQAKIQEARRLVPRNYHLGEEAATLEALVSVDLDLANKDNLNVYMEQVPNPDTLPQITPHSLVKPMSPVEILDPPSSGGEGEQLFSNIVPESSTRALSKYTEMVDNLTRDLQSQLEDMSEELHSTLLHLELPELLQATEGGLHGGVNLKRLVPGPLLAELQQLQGGGGGGDGDEDEGPWRVLDDHVSQLRQLRAATAHALQQPIRLLDDEQQEDEGLRSRFGSAWSRPPSGPLTQALREKAQQLKAHLAQAEGSDGALESRVAGARAAMSLLHPDRVGDMLPRLKIPMVNLVDDDTATSHQDVLGRLRNQLGAVEALGRERARLEGAIRHAKNQDNILAKVMTNPDSFDQLFQAELEKYAPLKSEIGGLASQVRAALGQLTTTHAEFTRVFQVSSWRSECSGAVEEVRTLIRQFHTLQDNLQEGVMFYSNLQDAVQDLQSHCTDFCYSRNLQKKDLKEQLQVMQERRQEEERNLQAISQMQYHNRPQQAPPPPPPQHFQHPPPPPPHTFPQRDYQHQPSQPHQSYYEPQAQAQPAYSMQHQFSNQPQQQLQPPQATGYPTAPPSNPPNPQPGYYQQQYPQHHQYPPSQQYQQPISPQYQAAQPQQPPNPAPAHHQAPYYPNQHPQAGYYNQYGHQ